MKEDKEYYSMITDTWKLFKKFLGQVKENMAVLKDDDVNTDEKTHQVFTKDYITTVNMTVTSLAKAYNVLPNLLGGGLELGVELTTKWIQAETTNVLLNEND